MNDHELKQRIRYLAEHGGLWDDPMADIRRLAKVAVGVAVCNTLLIVALHV